jgi:very-short-patch-repair endonuclease
VAVRPDEGVFKLPSPSLSPWERNKKNKEHCVYTPNPLKKEFARKLRKNETPSEHKLWQILRNRRFLELKFRRQHVLYGLIVDFYCSALNLAIEIDGSIHLLQKDYNQKRQWLLEQKNISFLRISNIDVFKNLPEVLTRIECFSQQHKSNIREK